MVQIVSTQSGYEHMSNEHGVVNNIHDHKIGNEDFLRLLSLSSCENFWQRPLIERNVEVLKGENHKRIAYSN